MIKALTSTQFLVKSILGKILILKTLVKTTLQSLSLFIIFKAQKHKLALVICKKLLLMISCADKNLIDLQVIISRHLIIIFKKGYLSFCFFSSSTSSSSSLCWWCVRKNDYFCVECDAIHSLFYSCPNIYSSFKKRCSDTSSLKKEIY